MTVLLVTNPASGSFDARSFDELDQRLAPLGPVRPFTASTSEAFEEELRAAAAGVDTVVVAGGDGTFGRAVNALADRLDEVSFGLVPAGTGNDLATTLGLDHDPLAAAGELARGEVAELDLGRVWGGSMQRFFVNACVGGFSVDVDEALEEATKRRLGRFAFWVGGLKAAVDITRYEVSIDGKRVEDAVVVGIGNGRTVGGGLELWPNAEPDDGELDACVISAPTAVSGAGAALRVKKGTHERSERVTTGRGRSITVTAEPPMEMNVDGEVVGLETPLSFEVARTFRMLVPPRDRS